MASGSSSVKGKGKIGENLFADGNDIFGFLQSSEMNYDLDTDELEIHLEEEAQVKIPTQRSETQADDRSEEDSVTASQKLKSDLFVHYFTKIKNDLSTITSVSCK